MSTPPPISFLPYSLYSTQPGEWPFNCLVYERSKDGTRNFIGGATLLAPGVVITGAAKVE